MNRSKSGFVAAALVALWPYGQGAVGQDKQGIEAQSLQAQSAGNAPAAEKSDPVENPPKVTNDDGDTESEFAPWDE